MSDHPSDAQAIITAVHAMREPTITDVGGVSSAFVPVGMTRVDLQSEIDKRAPAPRRAIGTVEVHSPEALIALVAIHATPSTVVYADTRGDNALTLTAVINDHAMDRPGWRDHRVRFRPTESEEWSKWMVANGQPLTQDAFATFIEDRSLDLVPASSAGEKTRALLDQLGVRPASPADLQSLARGLSIRVEQNVKEIRRLDSGEAQVVYSEEHRGDDGKPLLLPNAFVIAIPVFEGGPLYAHVVRLRYRVSHNRISWSFSVVHAEHSQRDAVSDILGRVAEALPNVLVVDGEP